ncbi:hypothetical protein CBS101457_004054 [Exobasidium rhododendri]|nr:hypothetical protein CBS101457_004054 [Exobasidium rhododendri]
MGIVTRPRDITDPFYRSTSTDYTQAYHSILRAARGVSSHASSSSSSSLAAPVLFLVSTDIDAICASRALVSLLSDDEIPYKICPVDGYSTLSRIVEDDVENNESLHTIIMLNLGSILSLPDFFTSAADPMPGAHILPDHCHVHLIDSHRPYNLDNLFATSRINDRLHVWDDGEVQERLGREEKAYSALEFLDDDSSEEESDGEQDGHSTEGEGEEDGPRKRVKRFNEEVSKKRLPPNVINGHRKVLTRYYNRGATYGMSISGVMLMLAEKLGRAGNENLWLAILGLTSQYTSSQIPHGLYNDLSRGLASDVKALNPEVTLKASHAPDDGRIRVVEKELRFSLYRHWSLEASMYHSSYVAGKMGIWKERGVSRLRSFMAKMGLSLVQCRQTFEHMDLDLRQSLVDRIEAIAPEYELMECIYRSFIRTFGFRCSAMSAADIVDGLEALLCAAHGVRIEVESPGLAFGGIGSGAGGARGGYSASLGVQGLGSDMFSSKKLWQLGKSDNSQTRSVSPAPPLNTGKENEAPKGGEAEHGHDDDGDDQEGQGGGQGRKGDRMPQEDVSQDAYWVQNFFAVYNALDTRRSENLNMLRASLNLSKALQDVVIRQGVAIIDKQLIRTLRNFRLVVLKDGSDLKLFHNTQILTKLGFWLVDALRDLVDLQNKHLQQQQQQQQSKKRRSKTLVEEQGNDMEAGANALPFVIAALNEKEEIYTIVGINASMQYGDVLRNNFGFRFQQAIQESNSRSKHDKFETSAVEVKKEDFPTFIEALHSAL